MAWGPCAHHALSLAVALADGKSVSKERTMSLVADCFFLMKSENYDPFVVRWIWLKTLSKPRIFRFSCLAKCKKVRESLPWAIFLFCTMICD